MARSAPTTITLPPFSGTVRRLIFANVGIFFAVLILRLFAREPVDALVAHLVLQPVAVLHGQIWQLVTYSFLHFGIFDIVFTMLTLWFCGTILEGAYGSRWLGELYFASAIGGALLGSALSFTRLLHLSPYAVGSGAWSAIFGVLIALAVRFGDQQFLLFPLPISIPAKYLVGLDILIALAVVLMNQGAFAALLELSGALAGYLWLRYAPHRGMGFSLSEQYYGLRNAYYRSKRRRAARKFEVYMGKQGRQVRFDDEGRYIDPDSAGGKDPSVRRDPNDRKWMN